MVNLQSIEYCAQLHLHNDPALINTLEIAVAICEAELVFITLFSNPNHIIIHSGKAFLNNSIEEKKIRKKMVEIEVSSKNYGRIASMHIVNSRKNVTEEIKSLLKILTNQVAERLTECTKISMESQIKEKQITGFELEFFTK